MAIPKNPKDQARAINPHFFDTPESLSQLDGKNEFEGKTFPIEPKRWDQVYEYSFAIYDGDLESDRVVLDLPPSSLAVSVSFANSVSATNKGILEEHNGVVFRNISISGTTGILPKRRVRESSSVGIDALKQANKFLPATVGAVQNLVSNANKLFGNTPSPESDDPGDSSGYVRFWKLHNLFVAYAERKKNGESNLRLVFDVPKDNVAYLVTPLAFDLRKDASQPLLYRYSIQLKSWGILEPKSDEIMDLGAPTPEDPATVRKFLDTLRRTRQTIQSASNVLRGVQSDVNQALDAVNQTVLVAKDIVGVGATIADFPLTIKSNIETLINSNASQWDQVFNSFNRSISGLKDLAIGTALAVTASSAAGSQANQHDSGDPAATADAQTTKSVLKVLDDPSIADGIEISAIEPLPPAVREQLDSEIQRASNTTPSDVRNASEKLKELSENYANATGMMDAEYAAAFGVTAADTPTRSPNEDDILLAVAIEEQRSALIESLSSGSMYSEKPENLFEVANSVLEAEDSLPTPISSYAIIVNKGATLERMALTHLGDIRRSREIAVLNNLRAPYIDEEGFILPISNISERSFVVADRSNLAIGQNISILADGRPGSKRKIVSIASVGGGVFEVSVDGRADLSSYSGSYNLRIHARRPGTVGSGDTLLMPSQSEPDLSDQSRLTPLSDRLSFAERIFKVDVALQENGDLAMGTDGDLRRSYGYANAVQALKLLVEVEQGELELHPSFGINASVGRPMVTEVMDEVGARIKASVLRDSRFDNAIVNVRNTGTELNIRIEAKGKNNTGLIPVEFKVTL